MKIVVPIMPKNLSEIAKLDTAQYANADLVEWRADFMCKMTLTVFNDGSKFVSGNRCERGAEKAMLLTFIDRKSVV